MKKTTLYIIIPLLALGVFIAYYWNFNATYNAKMAAAAAEVRHKKEDEIRKENEASQEAVKEALAAQEVRKAARLAKEAAEAKKRDDREAAQQARSKAAQDAQTSKERVDRLTKEVAGVQDDIKKIDEEKAVREKEEAFLKTFVLKVQSNQQSLTDVLTKIDAANAANAAAARAAALAASKKS